MPLFRIVFEITPVEQPETVEEAVGTITSLKYDFKIAAPDIEAAGRYSRGLALSKRYDATQTIFLDKKLKDFGVFCVRTLNALKFNNIVTLGDLVNYSRRDLLELRGIGRWSLNEILKLFTDLSNNDKSFDLKLKP